MLLRIKTCIKNQWLKNNMEISEILKEAKLKGNDKNLQFFCGTKITLKFFKPEIPELTFINSNCIKLW